MKWFCTCAEDCTSSSWSGYLELQGKWWLMIFNSSKSHGGHVSFSRLYEIDENMYDLPELDNAESERLRAFVNWLHSSKPYPASIRVVRWGLKKCCASRIHFTFLPIDFREDGKHRHHFTDRLIEDRMDNTFSYFEFLQHLKQQMKWVIQYIRRNDQNFKTKEDELMDSRMCNSLFILGITCFFRMIVCRHFGSKSSAVWIY